MASDKNQNLIAKSECLESLECLESSEKPFSNVVNSLLLSGNLGGWQQFFERETQKEYFCVLCEFLDLEYSQKRIFPPVDKVFSAFTICDLRDISLVILGQDPYHEENQAVGLAFSVPVGEKIPPSLRNIYKELYSDLGITLLSGDISHWGKQGAFLLNTVLTVECGKANSHAQKGWETFTRNAILHLVEQSGQLLFLLFGKPAEKFSAIIPDHHHKIITSHPSPLSAYRGFLGSKVFSRSNEILRGFSKEINWQKDNI
ncbi:MAG: uracil-DNA glycosylase [Bacillota bacterium]